MKKILVAILCLFFLGACSRGNGEEQTEVSGNHLELGVRSGDVVTPVSMAASVYELNGLSSNLVCVPKYFTAGEKISFQDLLPGEYTYFVLGNVADAEMATLYLYGRDLKEITLRWNADTLPELFGGVVKASGSKEVKTVVMKRLVGGVKVHITNESEFRDIDFYLRYGLGNLDTISMGDYTMHLDAMGIGRLDIDKAVYLFPTAEPLRGEIVAWDENGQEYYFDFESKNSVQRNKRLELNLTLNKASSVARSANVVNTVTCVEKVTEL